MARLLFLLRSVVWLRRVSCSLLVVLSACGAKTGLEIPTYDSSIDAELPDAGLDAGYDSAVPFDSPCPAFGLRFSQTVADVIFLLDRSGSMSTTWEGLPFGAGLPSRWMIVRDTLADTIPRFDRQLRFGANLFPTGLECGVSPGIAVPARLGGASAVLGLFDTEFPEGGTPTADGLRATLDALGPRPERPQVIVLTTDGAPNCNPDTGVPPDVCVCTGSRRACLDPDRGAEACLDDVRTVDVIRESFDERGVPVLVVGIDNPRRPDLGDALDRMAEAGGWPRVGAARRFYSALDPDDLRVAFADITERIANCVLVADRPPPPGAETTITVDGIGIPQDPTHTEGWDWSDEDSGVLVLYGGSCDRLRMGEADVRGLAIACAL